MSIQPQNDGWRLLEEHDTGMGTNPETIRDELLEGAQEKAEELGFDYEPGEETFKVYFLEDESKAVLYAESWGGAPKIIAETTAYECTRRVRESNKCPDGREVRIGNSSEIEVNEGTLRGAAQYLEEKRT